MREEGAAAGRLVRPFDIHIMKKSDVKLYSDEIYEEEFPDEAEEQDEEQ